MSTQKFNELILSNFDVSFNYQDVFYMISTYDGNGKSIISLANENHWYVEFINIDNSDKYILIDKSVFDIINELTDKDIYC